MDLIRFSSVENKVHKLNLLKWLKKRLKNWVLNIPGFSTPVQTGPVALPASCTMGTGSFPGVKRPGRGVDHPPHLAPKLKEE